jgi:hypothetical protein
VSGVLVVTEGTDKRYPEKGDWVLVWGQVREGKTHPEDVIIGFASHSEQYECHIKTDAVVVTVDQPDFVRTCTAMFEFMGGPNGLFVRCALHEQHGEKHRDSAGTTYEESDVVGYFEEAS